MKAMGQRGKTSFREEEPRTWLLSLRREAGRNVTHLFLKFQTTGIDANVLTERGYGAIPRKRETFAEKSEISPVVSPRLSGKIE
jgi:hypothetical protein